MRWALQMAVLAALIAMFAMQIPRSALFFRPAKAKPVEPHAAFVTLDDAAYASLMRRIRTAEWPGALHGWNEGTMPLGAGVLALEDAPPAPPGLGLPDSFAHPHAPMPQSPAFLKPSLKPESFAMPVLPPIPTTPAPPPVKEKRAAELLDVDGFESLKERK